MQNLPLSDIRTSDVFYCRQMWYYAFDIHGVGKNTVFMNVHEEFTGRRTKLIYFPTFEVQSGRDETLPLHRWSSGLRIL